MEVFHEETINLNDYEEFLNLVEKHLEQQSAESLSHYGVLGMKWGVRRTPEQLAKAAKNREKLKGIGPDKIERTTSRGEKITLTKNTPSPIARFVAKHSKTTRQHLENSASLTIANSSGKTVGSASVSKVSDEELNLVWVGIKGKHRGQGYATAVMEAAVEFGEAEGLSKLTLEVPGNSPDARHIYEKLGFKVTNESTDEDDLAWGGLTNMEYDVSRVKQSDKSSTLSHYGILGMKWGVRRSPEQLRRAARKRGDSRDWDTARSEAKDMSDTDLKSRVSRLQLEKQYADLSAPKDQKKTNSGAKKAAMYVGKESGKLVANIAKQELTRQVQKELRKRFS